MLAYRAVYFFKQKEHSSVNQVHLEPVRVSSRSEGRWEPRKAVGGLHLQRKASGWVCGEVLLGPLSSQVFTPRPSPGVPAGTELKPQRRLLLTIQQTGTSDDNPLSPASEAANVNLWPLTS